MASEIADAGRTAAVVWAGEGGLLCLGAPPWGSLRFQTGPKSLTSRRKYNSQNRICRYMCFGGEVLSKHRLGVTPEPLTWYLSAGVHTALTWFYACHFIFVKIVWDEHRPIACVSSRCCVPMSHSVCGVYLCQSCTRSASHTAKLKHAALSHRRISTIVHVLFSNHCCCCALTPYTINLKGASSPALAHQRRVWVVPTRCSQDTVR